MMGSSGGFVGELAGRGRSTSMIALEKDAIGEVPPTVT
jgi:hypothetical protein